MRCLDQYGGIIFAGTTPERAREFIRDHVIAVDIDNAVRWFFEKNSQEIWNYEEDFPCVLSPWMFAWYETGTPAYSNSEGQILDVGARTVFRKWGWNTWQIPLKQDVELPREHIMIGMMRMIAARQAGIRFPEASYNDEQMTRIAQRRPAFAQSAICWGFTWQDEAYPLLAEGAYLDETGRLITTSRWGMLLAPNQHLLTEEQKQSAMREVSAAFLSFYFALCLLHTKNVIVKDEERPPRNKVRHTTIKRIPRTQFKILDIAPLRQEVRHAIVADTTSNEIKKALHLCRGHYRRYTEESKLFGKHTGIFWIPAHMRGSKDAGEIKKDYRVLSPKEKIEQ